MAVFIGLMTSQTLVWVHNGIIVFLESHLNFMIPQTFECNTSGPRSTFDPRKPTFFLTSPILTIIRTLMFTSGAFQFSPLKYVILTYLFTIYASVQKSSLCIFKVAKLKDVLCSGNLK